MPRQINKIVIHCSYTYPDMDVDIDWIRNIHVNENGWGDVGYHKVIKRDGTAQDGRDDETIGAHTRGHNADSIAICLIGGKARGKYGSHQHVSNFTHNQMESLRHLVKLYKMKYPQAEVVGHCDLDATKPCPNFDVKSWAQSL